MYWFIFFALFCGCDKKEEPVEPRLTVVEEVEYIPRPEGIDAFPCVQVTSTPRGVDGYVHLHGNEVDQEFGYGGETVFPVVGRYVGTDGAVTVALLTDNVYSFHRPPMGMVQVLYFPFEYLEEVPAGEGHPSVLGACLK